MSYSLLNQYKGMYGNLLNSNEYNNAYTSQFTTPNLAMPYTTAPTNIGNYEYAQSLIPEVYNPLDAVYKPTAAEQAMTGLSYAQAGTQVLGMKIGEQTLGTKLFGKNFGTGTGAKFANPFTTNASAGTFEAATAGSGTTAVQAGASNYFSNLSQGSVSAGLPTYIAGRLVRSAFDDDDPTTFSAGEMLGAGISGAGAGSAIAGMLGLAGPVGMIAGIGISLLGGAKKKKKAKKMLAEYQAKVDERKAEIKEMYQEGIGINREMRERQSQSEQYMQYASQYRNPYGMGNYRGFEKGGKFDQYFLGGLFDAVGDLFGAGADIITGTIDTISNVGEDLLDVTAGAATEVGSAAVDVLETTGVTDVLDLAGSGVQTVMEEGVKPVVDAAMDVTFGAIETGIDLASDTLDFGLNMAADTFGAVAQVPLGIMEGAADMISGLGGGDYQVPDLPPLQISPADPSLATPNITTVDPYGNPVRQGVGLDPNLVSGSFGFVTPEMQEGSNIYQETQEKVWALKK